MKVLVPMLSFTLLLNGCIIYDHTGKCRECTWEDSGGESTDSSDPGGDSNGTGGDDSGGEVAEPSFVLSPAEGLIGSVFITSLTAENFDLSTVAESSFYGDVELIADQNRGDEILYTLSVPADAPVGTADLLLVMEDGTAKMLEDVLSLVEVLTEEPDDPNGSGSGGGSGSGSGGSSGGGSGGGGTDSGCD
jgi:uncharacterized membrane protein YgcG